MHITASSSSTSRCYSSHLSSSLTYPRSDYHTKCEVWNSCNILEFPTNCLFSSDSGAKAMILTCLEWWSFFSFQCVYFILLKISRSYFWFTNNLSFVLIIYGFFFWRKYLWVLFSLPFNDIFWYIIVQIFLHCYFNHWWIV